MENEYLDEIFDFEITLGPWSVSSHPDTAGAYIIKEALHEQQVWGAEGYDVSAEEGDRRDLIAERRHAGNVRLIRAAPELFEALRNLLLFPDTERERAIATLESIAPNWQTIVTGNRDSN